MSLNPADFPHGSVGDVLLGLFAPEHLPMPAAGGEVVALSIADSFQVCVSLRVATGTPLPPDDRRLYSEVVDETHHLHRVIAPYGWEWAGDARAPDSLLHAPTDAGAADRVRVALQHAESLNVAQRLVLAALPLVQPGSLAHWLEHVLPARLLAYPWATATAGTVEIWGRALRVHASLERIEARPDPDGLMVPLYAAVRVVQKDTSGTVVHVREQDLWLDMVPERARLLPVPADIDDALDRWVQASVLAIRRFWLELSDEAGCSPGSLPFPVGPGLFLTAHARWGPPPPQPEPFRLRGTPRLVLGDEGQPVLARFEVGPDWLEVAAPHGRDLQITLHTTAGAVLLVSRDGFGMPVEVLQGDGAAMRVLMRWLAAATQHAGDPQICLMDPEDAYDEEGDVWFLRSFLGAPSDQDLLDWRIELDAFATPRTLPDRPGAAQIWADFLHRHAVDPAQSR